ncbi:MAG: right-handed parallel beta-helix repeat-containing protein [Spiribacter salinus]|uniref:Right-handed parallel beta-helix repeat-containing protein n=1 Tax=Spiribacter salinus TaxID=1335746 RepID=A0A540VN12_9GAMM|nr:MAG: right-handed parallel beta-helix repeat-containing protein [Spiribacter salinus]
MRYVAGLTLLSCAVPVAAAEFEATVRDMSPGEWRELPGTQMSSVFPAREGHPAWAIQGPVAVTKTWGGAAFDTKRNELLINGGGHNDYGGNEVYAFSLERSEWRRLTDPSGYVPISGKDGEFRTTDGSPVSSHTYDGLVYLPAQDALFKFGGSQHRVGTNYEKDAFLLDLQTGSWTRGAEAPNGSLEVASAYDPQRNRVLVNWHKGLMAYDPAEDEWSVVRGGDSWDYGRVAAYAPDLGLLVQVGNRDNPVVYHDVNARSLRKVAPIEGDLGFDRIWAPGVEYHPGHQVFYVWAGGGAVWTIDPRTWRVVRHEAESELTPAFRDADGEPKARGIYSRWQYVPDYGVFIGYLSTRGNVWVYRPPAAENVRTSAERAQRADEGDESTVVGLPPPGRLSLPGGATETDFPRPGRIARLPTSGASDETDSVGARLAGEDCGADLCVGPDYFLEKPSDAARLLRPDETVHIQAGEYEDCAVWQHSVVIRGVGGRPHIRDRTCNGKAVWVVQGERTRIENVEISGGRAGDGTGNAIRHEGGELSLDEVAIHGNQIGVLTNRGDGMSLEVEDSEFYGQINRNGLGHSIYANKIGRLVVTGSYFHDGNSGHYVKTLAEESDISYNRFVDAEGVDAHMVDIWGCGSAQVRGNAMMRVGQYGNLGFIGITPRREYGEWVKCPEGRRGSFDIDQNTAVFAGPGARWSSLVNVKVNVPVTVTANLGVQLSALVTPDDASARLRESGGVRNNVFVGDLARADALFANWREGDLTLRQPVRKPEPVRGDPIAREPAIPLGTRPRASVHDAGAHEFRAEQ